MCRQIIYYNTYGDGSEDVTQRVETCRPGKMCTRLEHREYQRQFRFTKLGASAATETAASLADRRPTPYATADFLELPPTPRSKTPSPSRKHESGVYVNGEKIASIHTPSRRDKRNRTHVVVHAPEPPSPRIAVAAPRPILKRSSTLPSDYVVIEDGGRGRHGHSSHRREGRSHHRTSSRDISVGPAARILDDHLAAAAGTTSRHGASPSRSASPRPAYYREHARSPREYRYVDDSHRERRKSRRSTTHGSDVAAAAAVYVTPASSPPRKEVHFTADPPVSDRVREQNERIARRPKVHQEVKGILKKDGGAEQQQYDELRKAVGMMDIHPSRQDGDGEYWDRLRGRFDEPRERRRKSRVHYPGEGVYKYA
jgi:hypothetical protein